MSHTTKEAVDCPICGEQFDPSDAGGWCTNPDCGKWQYDTIDDPEAESGPSTKGGERSTRASGESGRSTQAAGESGRSTQAAGESGRSTQAAGEQSTRAATSSSDASGAGTTGESVGRGVNGIAGVSVDSGVYGTAGTPVECPLCEEQFNPATAGGWCTNSDCGKWQYDVVGDDAGSTGAGGEGTKRAACPDCGESVHAGDNFCVACGSDLAAVGSGPLTACPGCGGSVDAADSFCATCGEHLDDYRSPKSLVLVVRNRELQVQDGDTVGRKIRSIVIDTGGDEDEAFRIHREHVKFVRQDGEFYAVALGQNPTVVNGDALEEGEHVPVSPGDRIELSGVAQMRVESP